MTDSLTRISRGQHRKLMVHLTRKVNEAKVRKEGAA